MDAPLYETPQVTAKERRLDPPAIQRLAEIDVPTLVIVGDADMPDMMTIADKIEAGVKGARKVVMSGVAHMPNMEQPQKFNSLVTQFVASL
jgi:pimeloyl-ACP methyl ester carboxylesterase